MEEGDLKAYGRGVALYWKKEGLSLWRAGETLDWGAFCVDLHAYRCSSCKTVVFNYGSDEGFEREIALNSFPFDE